MIVPAACWCFSPSSITLTPRCFALDSATRCQRTKRLYVAEPPDPRLEPWWLTSRQPSTPNKAITALSTNSPRAESPTTARPLNFDDEEPQESGTISTATGSIQQSDPETAPAPPPKPPRPLSPREQSELTLKEAFPSLDGAVVKAVLVASNWNVERAFNALLGLWRLGYMQQLWR